MRINHSNQNKKQANSSASTAQVTFLSTVLLVGLLAQFWTPEAATVFFSALVGIVGLGLVCALAVSTLHAFETIARQRREAKLAMQSEKQPQQHSMKATVTARPQAAEQAAEQASASVAVSDTGLPKLANWQAPEGSEITQLLMFDVKFNNATGSEWPISSLLELLGGKVQQFCENRTGLFALHADTLTIAVAMEAGNRPFKLAEKLQLLLEQPLMMGKHAPTVRVTARLTEINELQPQNLRSMQLAQPLPNAHSSRALEWTLPARLLPVDAANDAEESQSATILPFAAGNN